MSTIIDRKPHSSIWIQALLWLLAVSFLFTILSRAADSFTVANVTACSPTARIISHSFKTEGKIEKSREVSVITEPDILIKTIEVNEGQQVSKGDLLAVLDPDDLKNAILELRGERTTLELQNQEAKDTQKQEQDKQEQALKRAISDYNWLKKQNDQNQEQLKYDLWKAKKALQDAKIQAKKDKKTNNSTNVDNDTPSADSFSDSVSALQEKVDEQKKNLSEQKNTARTEEETAKRTIEDAMMDLPVDNSIQINQISIQKLNRQIDKLLALQKKHGKILAPSNGTITGILATTGQKTTNTALFTMTDETAGLKFAGQITPEEAELVSIGTTITLTHAGQESEVPITSLESDEEQGSMILTAFLPPDAFSIGDTVTASFTQESESYPCTVPVTAIYEDNGKKYILYLDTENTVLGKQTVARKTEVQIIEQNDQFAALESETISNDSRIISDTDRSVKAGDRIRLTEN